MGGAADVAILAAAMSGTVLFGYALIARAGQNRSRLALALQVAQYEAALRGHDDVDEAHLLHALLHDRHATTGVIAPDHLLAWQDASGRFLSSRPADTPAGGTLPASSPELDARTHADQLRTCLGASGTRTGASGAGAVARGATGTGCAASTGWTDVS